jgi:hypothetical protein
MSHSTLFECQAGLAVPDPTPKQLRNLLSTLDGQLNSFGSLTRSTGTYLQAGGGPRLFVVEQRLTARSGEFSHHRAALQAAPGRSASIAIGGNRVIVGENQLIPLELVQHLFTAFLQKLDFPSRVRWDDISNLFNR